MTEDEEYELYQQKRKKLEKEIQEQQAVAYNALLAYQHEIKKLTDLEIKLRWAHINEDKKDASAKTTM